MGFIKKIFGGKKKKKEGLNISADSHVSSSVGNPSVPTQMVYNGYQHSPTSKFTNSSNANGNFPQASKYNYDMQHSAAARYHLNPPSPMHAMNAMSPRSASIDFNSPRSSTGPVDTDDEGIILPDTDNVEEYYKRAQSQTQEELRIAYEQLQRAALKGQSTMNSSAPRFSNETQTQEELQLAYEQLQRAASKGQSTMNSSAGSSNENISYNANIADSSADSSMSSNSARLTTNQLKQWDRSNMEQQNSLDQQFSSSPTSQDERERLRQQTQTSNSQAPPKFQQRVYAMTSALPSQQQFGSLSHLGDDDGMNNSVSDASSFNLSTDAEDSEYETMKRLTVPSKSGSLSNHQQYDNNPSAGSLDKLASLDTSAIDTAGSIISYTTDEDRKIFPNLPTDDDMTLGTEASSNLGQPMPPSLLLQPLPNPLQVTVPNKLLGDTSELHTDDDSDILPDTMERTSTARGGDAPAPNWNNFLQDPPDSTKSISRNKPGVTPRNFTSPKITSGGHRRSKSSSEGLKRGSNFSSSNSRNLSMDDGFGSFAHSGSGAKTGTNNIEDGFGSPFTANSRDSDQQSRHKKAYSADADGFSDFGSDFSSFADFDGFPATSNKSKNNTMSSTSDWASHREEKKDSSWDKDFFENSKSKTKTALTSPKASSSNSPFEKSPMEDHAVAWPTDNDDGMVGDPAWNVNTNVTSPASSKNNNSSYNSNHSGGNNTSRDNPNNSHNSNSSGNSGNNNDPFYAASNVGSSIAASSDINFDTSAQDTSLAELLEAAKSKRKDRKSYGHYNRRTTNNRLSTSSVNSAPAITSAYLRQHHNLGSSKSRNNEDDARNSYTAGANSYSNNALSPTHSEGATSVSDIIKSLEATDRMKRSNTFDSNQQSHRSSDYGIRSMGDTGVVAQARAAKERIRERRRLEQRKARTGAAALRGDSDSDDSNNDQNYNQRGKSNSNSESWLFDQVTGAMGPAGIAADLESLSGRSRGSRSHKSSSVAGRSRRSSRHRKKGRSDRSVDSHGSRTSRYSHRSTKSFLSQMSEQSRSVANDLLRLEMQLAMVSNNKNGSNNNTTSSNALVRSNSMDNQRTETLSARMASSGVSLGGGSRTSARSRKSSSRQHTSSSSSSNAVVRYSKTDVLAPPGKLGIILANKADSKGTVVSGVRTSSVLVDRISPGDRIVAIDGEDVSRMTVSEITTIMSRKSEYERRLTVLTSSASGVTLVRSPEAGGSKSSPQGRESYNNHNYNDVNGFVGGSVSGFR